MGMMIRVKSFNATVLNNADYFTYGLNLRSKPRASLKFIDQAMADALYSGTFSGEVWYPALKVTIRDFENRHMLESQIKQVFRPGTEGLLVGTFTDENRDYQITCVVQSCTPVAEQDGVYIVILASGAMDWHTVSAETDTWAADASGETKNISVGGYSPTRLSLAITPTILPATGWAYQALFQLVNKPAYAYGVRPWCIALDTATLITASKMQADGDDIVLMVDGVVTKRWLADINTNHTHIWFNVNLAAGQSMTLLTPVANTGTITTLTFQKTANNAAALKALPARGYVQHGTEWFEYTGKNLPYYQLTGISRTALNTTIQAHALADVFNWIEHSIILLYGNSTATAPALTDAGYDDTKPVFDLSTSDNDTWAWTASTKFYDAAKPNRTGMWLPAVIRVGNESDVYDTAGEVEGAAPSMGMRISTWFRAGVKQAERATLSWLLQNAGGISEVSMTGRKYRNTASWPAVNAASLQRSANARNWYEVWNEVTPAAVSTWEAITHAASAITGSQKMVRFLMTGSLAALANVDCYFEVATASAEFVTANLPTGTLLAEKSNYLMNISIKNNTTGDQVNLLFPVLVNTTLTLDAENYDVTYGGVNAASALSLDDDSRAIWVRLNPGVNELVITGDDIATLTIVPSWYARRM